MAPVIHPGRLLKRELVARKLSANRLSLDIGVPSGRIFNHPSCAISLLTFQDWETCVRSQYLESTL
jgi:hypothetical protein